MSSQSKLLALAVSAAAIFAAAPASASLSTFQSWTGNIGFSSDGWGSVTSSSGTISASVPVGSTVLGAYLYTAGYDATTSWGGTLNGTTVNYGPLVSNTDACCSLASRRADVTSIVASVINGGAGGVYNFNVSETNTSTQDGEALVVVYRNSNLATGSFGLLDGFAKTSGDTTSVNFADALDPTKPGFKAEMVIGDNFSCCSQKSTIKVNGVTITENAGNNDKSVDPSLSNGNLITVGSNFRDPYSTMLPSYEDDHERYDLTAQISKGDTSIKVDTINASHDDNIFMAGIYVTGIAGFNEPPPVVTPVPEPGTYAMMVLGLGAVGAAARRRRNR